MIHNLTTQKGRNQYMKSLETQNSAKKVETENIYLNRLKEQYYEVKRCLFPAESDYVRARYGGMREFCLDTQLISFNDIELMEFEVNNNLSF